MGAYDNITPMPGNEYDKNIEKTTPFCLEFYKQTVDLVRAFGYKDANWLDTGCGTGSLVDMAAKVLPAFRYELCDPSEAMLSRAREKLSGNPRVSGFTACSSEQLGYQSEFEVVTAIQAHHYLRREERKAATQRCFEALKPGGVYITFENFAPNSEIGKSLVMERWGRYQREKGKCAEEVVAHQERYGMRYFPITLEEHIGLIKETGFKEVEYFWLSYMQVGIYAIK